MGAPLRVGTVALGALLVTGCVTTRIRTNEADARVVFDGRRVAPGQRMWAVGPPHRADVRVVARDGREVRAQLRREFSFGTFVAGFYTFGTCWILCWTYPGELTLLLPPRGGAGWNEPGRDPWLLPPPGWTPPAAPPAPPAEDDPARPADPWSAPPAN